MLEGKELVQPIGSIGEASVDLNDELKLVIEVKAKYEVDILAELEKMAAGTDMKLDDAIVDGIKKYIAAVKALKA